ncbi:MAG: glycosyltransferase family 2 protein [Coriobacteriia bacterium]|nr:glycosyltransferase family 2 protein [Coriobacteriia bacterium]
MSIVALVPAFNEATRIKATVRSTLCIPGIDRIVVIDDASTDDTSKIAREAGAEVLTLPRNLGKGAALDAGLAHVAEDADILLLLDGDLAETAAEGSALLTPILHGNADMTVATFPRTADKAGFGLVKGLARWGIARMGGGFLADAPLSGQRALSRDAWTHVTPFAFGYGVEVALTIRALRRGLRVVEVPTAMSHAATGRDLTGFMHRGRQFVHVLRALVRLAFERTPVSG